MRILKIKEGSAAALAGLKAGDELQTIDGQPLRDSLDFTFLSADEELTVRISRSGQGELDLEMAREPGEEWGIEIEPDPVRRCGNDCIFCFVDQNPRHLRRRLYVKDEDYRLSLFFGNYVTLTNLKEWEIERILTQHLSPLYVSVHATDPGVRRRMLRSRSRDDVLPLMRRLAEGGIRLHTQIVLVPGYNDGAVLERTLDDLEALVPSTETVAIVPVGLSRHRDDLPLLRTVSAAEAKGLVERIHRRQEQCLARHGSRVHFLADEIYLLAGAPLPREEEYESYPQVENGVGMVRLFDSDLADRTCLFDRPDPDAACRAAVITGELFAPLLEKRLPEALGRTSEREAVWAEILPVPNQLFGGQVTVAGLLGGRDIIAEVSGRDRYDLVVLPPEMLNEDAFTLDQLRVADLAEALDCAVQVGWSGRPIAVQGEERS